MRIITIPGGLIMLLLSACQAIHNDYNTSGTNSATAEQEYCQDEKMKGSVYYKRCLDRYHLDEKAQRYYRQRRIDQITTF